MRQGSRFVGACAAAFLAIVGLWLGGCSRKPLAIHVVVEDRLSGPLAGSVATFAADLRDAGYAVTVDGSRSAAQSPDELREALRQAWLASGKSLDGVVLVGEFSAALFNVGFRQGDPYWHDHLADLFYMDVDGLWGDADANGVFDSHRSYGDGWLGSLGNWMAERGIASIDRRLPEFWVSRLRAGTMAPLGDELELYRDYFRRNHEYRTSGPGPIPPRAFVVGPGAKLSESGWGARPRRLYRDSSVKECTKTASSEVRGFLADPRGWSLGIVGSFSGPQVHKFQYYEGGGFDATQFATIEGRKLIAEYSAMRHDPWDLASPRLRSCGRRCCSTSCCRRRPGGTTCQATSVALMSSLAAGSRRSRVRNTVVPSAFRWSTTPWKRATRSAMPGGAASRGRSRTPGRR